MIEGIIWAVAAGVMLVCMHYLKSILVNLNMKTRGEFSF